MLDQIYIERVISTIRVRLNYGMTIKDITEDLLQTYKQEGITLCDIYLCYKSAILLDKDLKR